MAPKSNKRDSSLDGTERRGSRLSSGEIVSSPSAIKDMSRLTEREVKHTKISNPKELHDSFTFGNEIGKGTFGTVMAVVDKTTNKSWALKVICKPTAGKLIKYVHNELRILKMVDHPHIIHLEKIYESDKKIYLVLERCIGELGNLLRMKRYLEETVARKIITELCHAVAYLHKYEIVHRDLKLENILLARNPADPGDDMFVKVADFGLSTVKKGATLADMLTDHCGTLTYMSPEMAIGSLYSQQCDIWSMGVILYLLLIGRFPFFSKDEEKLTKLICSSDVDFEFVDVELTAEAKDLISKMLAKNPAERLTASEVLQHAWTVGHTLTGAQPGNVLEMMRLWRSEMKVTGSEEDWLAATNVSCRERVPPKTDARGQYLQIPKTNIEFNRNAHKRN